MDLVTFCFALVSVCIYASCDKPPLPNLSCSLLPQAAAFALAERHTVLVGSPNTMDVSSPNNVTAACFLFVAFVASAHIFPANLD